MRIKTLLLSISLLLAVPAVPMHAVAHEATSSIQKQTFVERIAHFADFGLIAVAHADEPAPAVSPAPVLTVPDADIAGVLLNLATNYKTLGVLGILMLLTLLSVQAIKSFAPDDWKFKRLTVVIVSIVYSVLAGVFVPGSSPASVIITVFITGGGAAALYEALKGAGIIKKA